MKETFEKEDFEEIQKHYNESKPNYNITGESHLDYYKEKFPDNFEKLKKGK